MRKNCLPPAARCLADGKQRIELGPLDPFDVLTRPAAIDHPSTLDHIGHAVGHPDIGWQAVTAGAAGLLIIGLDRAGQIQMRDIADIWLVDTHAESNRGNKAETFFLEERILIGVTNLARHAGVVGPRPDTLLVEPFCRVLDLGAGKTVNDAARSGVAGQKTQQLLARLIPLDNLIGNVRTVERRGEHLARAQRQLVDDVFSCMRISRRSERHPRDAGIMLGEMTKFAIFRPEVMPPLRNAMGLVDRKQRNPGIADHVLETGCDNPLRCHIQKIKLAAADCSAHVHELFTRQRRIESRRTDTQLLERFHLVAHQRNQWRNNNAHAFPAQCRDLEAQRLARARGKQHHCITTRNNLVDHLGLPSAKGRIAIDPVQDSKWILACIAGNHGFGTAFG